MSDGILLEAGTNELELLVFRVGDTFYGINVAKVRELVQRVNTVTVPHSPPSVEGSFRLREEVLTLVDLGKFLGKETTARIGADNAKDEGLIIIIEFNTFRCGILVDAVEMIHRLRWDAVEPPSGLLADFGTPVTATARIDEKVVLILDFETIISELFGVGILSEGEEEALEALPEHKDMRLLVADDSPTVRDTVEALLRGAGFEHLDMCADGQTAWESIEKAEPNGKGLPYDLVITDIEMPRMDGLHLTARIRENTKFGKMPVVLFSSVIRRETINKGQQVGADAQVAKSDREGLLQAIDECLGIKPGASEPAET